MGAGLHRGRPGKLIAAARAILNESARASGTHTATLRADAEQLGVQLPPELLRELQPPALPEEGCVVWPEHRRAVQVFPLVRHQLRYGPGGPCGFDATAVEAVMRLAHVPPRRRAITWAQLMVMEGALLDVIYENAP